MGRSNVWYAEESPAFVKEVLDFIKHYPFGKKPPKPPRQPDLLKRIAVGKKAVEVVSKHYSDLGYSLKSVEKDNVGWDLEATQGKVVLKLEVKGLSGSELTIELTPNEYKKLNAHWASYRICVVTEALTAPTLSVFTFIKEANETGAWVSTDGRVLLLNEVISARGHCL